MREMEWNLLLGEWLALHELGDLLVEIVSRLGRQWIGTHPVLVNRNAVESTWTLGGGKDSPASFLARSEEWTEEELQIGEGAWNKQAKRVLDLHGAQ